MGTFFLLKSLFKSCWMGYHMSTPFYTNDVCNIYVMDVRCWQIVSWVLLCPLLHISCHKSKKIRRWGRSGTSSLSRIGIGISLGHRPHEIYATISFRGILQLVFIFMYSCYIQAKWSKIPTGWCCVTSWQFRENNRKKKAGLALPSRVIPGGLSVILNWERSL